MKTNLHVGTSYAVLRQDQPSEVLAAMTASKKSKDADLKLAYRRMADTGSALLRYCFNTEALLRALSAELLPERRARLQPVLEAVYESMSDTLLLHLHGMGATDAERLKLAAEALGACAPPTFEAREVASRDQVKAFRKEGSRRKPSRQRPSSSGSARQTQRGSKAKPPASGGGSQ